MLKFALIPAFLLLGPLGAQAQQSTPNAINGCIYVASAPTLSNGQRSPFLCDVNGNLKTTGGGGGGGSITFPATVVGGTSGGIPYFNSTTQMSSSALLGAGQVVIGGGAGQPPSSSSGLTFNGATTTLGINTFSAGGVSSVLMSNLAGASLQFEMRGTGIILPSTASIFTSGTVASLSFTSNGDITTGGSTPIEFFAGGYQNIAGLIINPGSPGNISIGGGAFFGASVANDTPLFRDAAGILAQRNGANAQIHRIYDSYTDGSNGSWGAIDAGATTAGVLKFGSYGNGTGASTLGKLEFDVLGVDKLDYGGGYWNFNAPIDVNGSITLNGSGYTFNGGAITLNNYVSAGSFVTAATYIKTGGYTVATLPAGAAGERVYVTDQLTACPTLGAAFTGGGSVVCPAFYGASWVSG